MTRSISIGSARSRSTARDRPWSPSRRCAWSPQRGTGRPSAWPCWDENRRAAPALSGNGPRLRSPMCCFPPSRAAMLLLSPNARPGVRRGRPVGAETRWRLPACRRRARIGGLAGGRHEPWLFFAIVRASWPSPPGRDGRVADPDRGWPRVFVLMEAVRVCWPTHDLSGRLSYEIGAPVWQHHMPSTTCPGQHLVAGDWTVPEQARGLSAISSPAGHASRPVPPRRWTRRIA